MKKIALTSLAAMAIVLAIQTPCHAHSLHPIFFGFGPSSLLAAIGSPVGWAAILAIVSIQAVIVQRFIPGTKFLGNLWRVGILVVASKVAQVAPALIHPDVFMGSCSNAMLALITILMFVVGIAVGILLIELMYRRVHLGVIRVFCLSLMMESTAVIGLYASNIGLLKAGFIW